MTRGAGDAGPLEASIVARIRRHGPLHLSEFVEIALYDARHGYYGTGAVRAGWEGDFVTSPQLDPAFGILWAQGVTDIWEALGRPQPFAVTEIGPGEGAFAAALLRGLPTALAGSVTYRLVERTETGRIRQERLLRNEPRVAWFASVEDVPEVESGVVLANEVVDNLPFDLFEVRGDRLVEVLVGERNGRLVETPGDTIAPPEWLEVSGVGDGHRIELRPSAQDLVRHASSTFARGALILIDYGYEASEVPGRPAGTAVSYSGSGADEAILERPGEKDITAHVNWTHLARALEDEGLRASGPHPQEKLLRALGAAELDRALQDAHDAALAEGRGADAVASLSRRHALRALLDPGGLGRLSVMAGLRGLDVPAFLGS